MNSTEGLPPRRDVERFYLNLRSWHIHEGSEQKAEARERIVKVYKESLTYLDLSSLKLCSLPKNLGKLTSLEVLDISDNLISDLPNSIGQCQSLRRINASYNVLADIPESTGTLKKLRWLNLSYNAFASIPSQLMQLPHACVVDLRGNNVDCFDFPNDSEGGPSFLFSVEDIAASTA